MKLFIVLLTIAAIHAEPEADPQLLVNPYHTLTYNPVVPSVYTYPVVTKPLVKPEEVKKTDEEVKKVVTYNTHPLVNPYFHQVAVPYVYPVSGPKVVANDAVRPEQYAGKNTYVASSGPGGALHVAKREAEPVWPYTTYSHYPSYTYTHLAHQPYSFVKPTYYPYTLGTYKNDAVSPYNYAHKGQYVAHSAGVTHVAKREAEPVWPYTVNTYAHTWPFVNNYYNYQPYVHAPVVTPSVLHSYHSNLGSYKNDAILGNNYAAKGQYVAKSAGATHIAKREAEPYYNVYGYNSLYQPYTTTYSTAGVYPYSTASVYPYNTAYTYPNAYSSYLGGYRYL